MSRLATRTAAVIGAAACVFAGGLVATRGGDRPVHVAPTAAAAAPVRANVDPLTTVLGSAGQVEQLQHAVAVRPDDGDLNARLGLAYLQRARETADPSFYPKADELLQRALHLAPGNLDATLGLGSLALSRHDFRGALRLGRQATAMTDGFSPAAKAIVGDAEIELGRYPARLPHDHGARHRAPVAGRVRPPVVRARAAGRTCRAPRH